MSFDVWDLDKAYLYIAQHVNISKRMLEDGIRNGCPMPEPFGRVGNSRLWDPLSVQAATPRIIDWFDKSPERAAASRAETLKQQEAARQRRLAEQQKEFADSRERYEFFRACEADNAARSKALEDEAKGHRAYTSQGPA
jgi:hypothetical protein